MQKSCSHIICEEYCVSANIILLNALFFNARTIYFPSSIFLSPLPLYTAVAMWGGWSIGGRGTGEAVDWLFRRSFFSLPAPSSGELACMKFILPTNTINMVIAVNVIPVAGYASIGNPVGAIIKAATSKKMHSPNILFISSWEIIDSSIRISPLLWAL